MSTPSPIAPISITPPRIGTLTASARRGLRGHNGAPIPISEWSRGVTWAQPRPATWRRDIQCEADLNCRPDPTDPDTGYAAPFRIGAIDGCEADVTPPWADYAASTAEMLALNESAEIARVLWNGTAGTLTAGGAHVIPDTRQTTFADATKLAAAAGPLDQAMARLISAARLAGYNGPLWFHAPDTLVPQALKDSDVTVIGTTFRAGDHTIILDAGYPGNDPADSTDAVTGRGTGTVWLVASGPVEFDTGAEQTIDINPYAGVDCYYNAGTDRRKVAIVRVTPWPLIATKVTEI